ncbi:hypothetical protein [Paenibacillus eucommiae]|uniref:Ni2+-binding GTPase n=1 Tax=Paenibacillus eucommiae TaxID=1355755 RepID=A0ABS4IR74_9BACL|nr:hypothetical protein [Paenibacillus eucommiae]MBP1990072.1 hypothetical protein [Paenibacillus eucommiae]
MSEMIKSNQEQIRLRLQQLFQDANREDTHLLSLMEQLLAENERLKQEVIKLRSASQAKLGSQMSSKLRDALRE